MSMNVKRIVMICLSFFALSSLSAVEWKDVTSIFIQNPGFDNNSSQGWTWTSNAGSQTVRAECMEFWQGTFNIWQELSGLPQGTYRLSVQSYYRPGNNSNSYNKFKSGNYDNDMTAYLYAGTARKKIVNIYSYELSDYVDGCWQTGDWWEGDVHYFPNTMESAAVAFSYGAYWNTMEFEGSGNMTIGLINENLSSDNWCIFDNFKLEYSGEVVLVNQVVLSLPQAELVIGEQTQCQAEVLPANALDKRLTWSSSNVNILTVDANGMVTALSEGTAVITAKATDGSNKKDMLTVKVVRNHVAEGDLLINEVMASNIDEFVSPAFNFDGWIELCNTTTKDIVLSGLYLSDDAANLKKWRIPVSLGNLPARGFKVIWFDSNNIAQQNAPFKLDVDGGSIFLSDADGQLITSLNYPASLERTSYARTIDGGDTWGVTAMPTPGATNSSSAFATQQLAAPVVDQPSQLFSGQLSVNVTIPSGCTLRYTIDGSLPTLTNGYSTSGGQFTVNTTRNYRFRLFANGMLPSRVTTRSYILRDRDYTLPIVSVVGDNAHLYGDDMGVLVKGNGNGRPGNGQSSPCNWNMDWERPVNMSYLDANGEMGLNQDVDLEMCGGWSRAWSPHSFKLKGTKEMGGNKNLPYAFFQQKPYIRNRTIQIRNGGNEYGNGRFKDAALGTVLQSSGIDVDVQSYQPVHEFINGKYIGVLNVREPNNKHYAYANYGLDDDEIDLFEMTPDSGYVQKCGTPDGFEELVTLSESAANSDTYAELCRRINMDEYINYMAAEFYLGSTDWPQNNVKAFTARTDGQWRFVLFDIDFSFNTNSPFNDFVNKEWYLFNELYPAGQDRIYAQIKFVTLFKNLLNNTQFRRRFIDAFCLMGGSVYEASRAAEIIDSLANRVAPAMALEGAESKVYNSASSIKSSLNSRLATATNYLRNYSPMGLGNKTAQSVTLKSDVEDAQLLINGQQVPTGSFKGNLFAPVTLKAVAPAGYAFQGWVKGAGGTATTLKAMESSWMYYDQGSLDGKNWTSPSYSTSGWKQGKAPLGYSNTAGIITTTIDYGSDSNNKRPTYYFRSTVNLSNAPSSGDVFTMDYYIDDGLIVYVNGTEAARFNMPSGSVSYSTLASTYADQFPTGTLTLPANLFHQGSNVIAVEVHNNALNSTDIIFDAAINAELTGSSPADYYATTPEISLPTGTVVLTASYRALSQQELNEQGVTPVRINEVSGSNNSLVNEYWKKSDWVELYNTTSEEIDVEGMYLTDNLEKMDKYMITKGSTHASTKIPAHGYLLVWCDKLATTDQALHASFKISGEGGVIALMAADKSWTDKLYYTAHDASTTVGRYPDGAAEVYAMNVATIAAPNLLTSYMVQIEQEEPEPTGIAVPMIAAANGLRISYGSQQLLLKSDDEGETAVDIYTTDGRLVEHTFVQVAHGRARLSVAHLPAGFYVARATSEQKTSVSCKFMK
jgi:hypothetical protein